MTEPPGPPGQPSAGPLPDPPDRAAVARVRRQALSVGVATGAYGVSFGALSVASGLDVWQTVALSTLMFTGGSQFALIGVVGGGGSGAAAVAAATLLGVRNGLYALQVREFLGVGGLRRIAAAQLTIDESTAVGIAQDTDPARRQGFWETGIAVFCFWNLFTLIGAVVGNALGDPRRWGLAAAPAAACCARLGPRLHAREPVAAAAIAVVLTVVTVPFAPAGVPVLVAGLAAVLVGWPGRSGRGAPDRPSPAGSGGEP